jgi:hypothetical protein
MELLRHRHTKEAETDRFHLQPPRHISTLPKIGIGAAHTETQHFSASGWPEIVLERAMGLFWAKGYAGVMLRCVER